MTPSFRLTLILAKSVPQQSSIGVKKSSTTARAMILQGISKRQMSSSFSAQRRQRLQYFTTSSPCRQSTLVLPQSGSAPSVVVSSASGANAVPPPSSESLKALFVAAAVPLIGFGFMDNLVMIQAGQFIDNTIGVQLGLATMTAAAAGQVVSDVSGVVFGSTLETALAPWIPAPALTAAQRALPISRHIRLAGAVCGVMLGCALGATSLLFMDLKARDRQEAHAQLSGMVQELKQLHPQLISVQWEHEGQSSTRASDAQVRARYSVGRSVVCVPILDKDEQVVGRLRYRVQSTDTVNYEDDSSSKCIQEAKMIAAHLGIVHQQLE